VEKLYPKTNVRVNERGQVGKVHSRRSITILEKEGREIMFKLKFK
jgi:hypothetical protein